MNNIFKNQLIALLTLMKSKAEGKGLEPSLRTDTVINMLKSTGVTIGYSQLQQMLQDPTVSDLVKSVDKNRIVLVGDDEETDPDLNIPGDDSALEQSPQLGQEPIGSPDFSSPDLSGTGMDATPTTQPGQEQQGEQPPLIPAGPSMQTQVSTMAKRALNRH